MTECVGLLGHEDSDEKPPILLQPMPWVDADGIPRDSSHGETPSGNAPRMMVRRSDLDAVQRQFGMNRAQRRAEAKKARKRG